MYLSGRLYLGDDDDDDDDEVCGSTTFAETRDTPAMSRTANNGRWNGASARALSVAC